MADPYSGIGATPDPYSGVGAAADPYASVGATPPASARAPGASGFGMISQTIGDLIHSGPANHDPNALEQGLMDAGGSKLVKGLNATYQQSVLSGPFAEPLRAAMEGVGYGRKPGESDASLHARYSQAIISARQQADRDVAASRIGAGNPNPSLAQRAERFGQQGANVAASIVANPEYMLLPGMGVGGSAATRIAAAGVGNAAVGGVSDAAAQLMDQAEGVKKGFDVDQNLKATVVSGLFGSAMHGAIEAAPFVKQLFTNRGVDTTPAADPRPSSSQITPMTSDHVAMNQADHQQYQQLLHTGSVDDIKQFFQGRNGPQPSWQDVNTWVEHRDGVTRPDGQPVQETMQPDFNYADAYNGIGENKYKTDNRQAVEDHVNSQMAGWKNAPNVEVVHGPEDIADPDIRAQALKEDANGDALGFLGSDNKVRMFSGRISDPATANAVLFHEGLGHFGLAQKFGDRLDQTLGSLLDRNVNQFSKSVDAWQKANPGAYGGDRIRAAEEVLAEASQNGQIKPSWRDAVSSAVRQFGRKMGLKLAYSDAEVNHILAMSHDAVINGKPGASANGFKGAKQDPEAGTKFTIGGVPVDRAPSIEPAPSHLVEHGAPLSFEHGETELPTSEGSGTGYIAKPNTLSREHLDAMLPHAEEAGGRYAPGRADTAFQFRSEAARDQFIQAVSDKAADLKFMKAANEGERPLSRAEQKPDDKTVVFDTRQKEGIEGIFPNAEEAQKFIDQHPDGKHLDYGTPREIEDLNPTGPESPEYEAYVYSKMIDAANQRLRQRGTLPANDVDGNNKYMTKDQADVNRREFLGAGAASAALIPEHALGAARTDLTDNMKVENAVKSGKLSAVIRAIKNTTNDPSLRRIATILDAGGVADAKIKVKPMPEDGTAAGETDPKTGDVTLYRSSKATDNGFSEETALHEALHSYLSQRYFELGVYGLKENRVKMGVSQNADSFVDHFVNDVWKPWSAMMDTKHPEMVDTTGTYDGGYQVWAGEAHDTPDELFVRSLTDPDLQHFLKTTDMQGEPVTPRDPNSWWSHIVDFFSRLLGIKQEDKSAFGNIMDAANGVLKSAALDKPTNAVANEVSRRDQLTDSPANKFITRSQLASDPEYKADDLEGIYKALDEGYEPTTRTFDEDRQAALKAGFKPSQIKAMQEHAPGDLSTRLYRMQAAANMADLKLGELNKKLDTPDWSEKDQADYIQAIADRNYLVTRIKGERAEIARALNISKAAKSYTNSTMQQMAEILEQNGSGLAGLAADPTAFIKFARQVKDMMEGGNPDGAHVLISGVNKPYWEQYLTTFHMNMMLSALSTHVKAPIDMGTGIARNVIEKALAIPVGKAREMFVNMTGREAKPGVEPAELAAHVGGVMRAVTDAEVYRRMAHAVKTGESSYVDAAGNATPTNFANTFGATSNPRIPVVSKPTDLISAQDTFFRSVEINAQLESLGIREAREQLGPKASISDVMTLGHTIAMDPLPTMLKEAYDLTNRTLLLNNNPLNNMINKARTYTPGMSVGQRVGAFVVTNLAPFIRVESNSLLNRVIQRSPLGFIDPTGYTQAQLREGGAKADIAMTKILYGTILMGMSWEAADKAKNYLTGNGPDNVDKYKEQLAAGRSPNAVHEGDRYNTGGQLGMSVNPFDQHNHTAQMVASMRQAYETGANKGQVGTGLKLALGSLIGNLSQMSWVSDIQPAVDAIRAHGTEGQNAVQSFAANEARTFSPNALNQAARMQDQVQRDTSARDSISERVGNELESTIPGLRERLPIKYSVYGNPLQNGSSLTGVHTVIPGLSGNGTTETHDPAERELDRLGSLVSSAIVTPVPKTITLSGGDKKQLTPAEFENYQRVAGRAIVETVRSEMGTDQWRNMSDQDRVLEVRSIQTDMKKAAKEALFEQ